jgi:hypothetical protein
MGWPLSQASPNETGTNPESESRARVYCESHWLIWFNGDFEGWAPSWFASRSDTERDPKTCHALTRTVNWRGL